MGELRNCPKCGKVFVRVNRNLCPACIEAEEEKFEEVRAYLKDNPGASIEEVAEAFDIEENVVLRWLKEGRIQDARIGANLTCQRCGSPIDNGNLCAKCAQALAAEMMAATGQVHREQGRLSQEEEEDSEKNKRRMFVVDRFK